MNTIPFLNKIAGVTPSMERQEWIEKALLSLREHFNSKGYKVPDNIRVPSPEMLAFIKAFEEANGAYPAGALTRSMREKKKTYLIKCSCPSCDYIVYATAKHLEKGDPVCPVDGEGMN